MFSAMEQGEREFSEKIKTGSEVDSSLPFFSQT
jgi:hypothetical protein